MWFVLSSSLPPLPPPFFLKKIKRERNCMTRRVSSKINNVSQGRLEAAGLFRLLCKDLTYQLIFTDMRHLHELGLKGAGYCYIISVGEL